MSRSNSFPRIDGKSLRTSKSLSFSSGYSVKAYINSMPSKLLQPSTTSLLRQPTPPTAYLTKLRMRERMQYGGPRLREVKRQENEFIQHGLRRTYTDEDIRLPPLSSRRRQDMELKREVLQSRAREAMKREQRRRHRAAEKNVSREHVGRSKSRDAVSLDPAPAFRMMKQRDVDALVRRIAVPSARHLEYTRNRSNSAVSISTNFSVKSMSPSMKIKDERAFKRLTKDTISTKLRAAFTYMFKPDPYNVKGNRHLTQRF